MQKLIQKRVLKIKIIILYWLNYFSKQYFLSNLNYSFKYITETKNFLFIIQFTDARCYFDFPNCSFDTLRDLNSCQKVKCYTGKIVCAAFSTLRLFNHKVDSNEWITKLMLDIF